MTIRSKEELEQERPKVDLTDPKGNAFVLLGYGKKWAKQLGLDWGPISEDATSGDYEHLLSVLEEHFGEYVDFYR